MNINKKKATEEWSKILGALAGTLIYAIGINFFVVPSELYTSGLLGFCQVIRTLLVDFLQLPLGEFDIAGVIYYLINIPILILAIRLIGRGFLLRTVVTVTAMTFFLAVIPIKPVVEDRLAASIVGGVVSGIGTGIALRMGSSLGGVDILGIIITQRKKDFSVGRMNLFLNLALYGICLLLVNMEVVVYSLIFAAVYSVAIDKVHIQNITVELHVITKADTEVLEKEVFHELGRGITKWSSVGAYTNGRAQVLYIVLSKHELNRLKAIIHHYDPEAFIVVNEGVTVDGNYRKKL